MHEKPDFLVILVHFWHLRYARREWKWRFCFIL